MDLFLSNAFLFYRNAHRILSDSWVSFATVPIILEKSKNGIRYVTLGALVEWWLNCEEDVTKDKEGHDALTYHLVGNALTGTNQCYCVYPDGQAEKIILNNFGSAWSSFMNTCKKYQETPEGIDVLTLEEVVNVLANAEMSIEAKLSTQLIKEECQRVVLEKKYDKLNNQHITLEDQYYHLAIEHHRVKLEEFRKEHILRKDKTHQAISQLDEKRAEYRTQMKQGLITNVEYQRLFMDLEKQKKTINSEFTVTDLNDTGLTTSVQKTLSGLVNELNTAFAEKHTPQISKMDIDEHTQTSIMMLWDNSPFRCDETEIVERAIKSNNEYEVRNIPFIFSEFEALKEAGILNQVRLIK